MVRQPDATMQPTPQDDQLMSKHRVLGFKPQLRLEWRGQDGQNETEQPDHSANLGVSITASTRKRFSVHTGAYPGGASTASAGNSGAHAKLNVVCRNARPGSRPRLGRSTAKAIDSQLADPRLTAATEDQFGHHGAGARAKLEAMCREAELMVEPLVTRTWSDDR